jgi:hypothetical protein
MLNIQIAQLHYILRSREINIDLNKAYSQLKIQDLCSISSNKMYDISNCRPVYNQSIVFAQHCNCKEINICLLE